MQQRILQQRAELRILAVEMDFGPGRRSGSVRMAFDGRCLHPAQVGAGLERMQRGHFGAAGAADAPGLFQHARAPGAGIVPALRDVVVGARDHEAVETLLRAAVVVQRLPGGEAQAARQHALHQRVEVAAHQVQARAAIDGVAVAVAGAALAPVVGNLQPAHAHLADADGAHVLQVAFQHQAQRPRRREGLRVEQGVELVEVPHHRLAAAAHAGRVLDAHRTVVQQTCAAPTRRVCVEGGPARQHHRRHAVGEGRHPACRAVAVDGGQRVRDDLGSDEGVRHDAAEQPVERLRARRQSEQRGLGPGQRLAGHQVVAGAEARGELRKAGVGQSEQPRQRSGQRGLGQRVVAVQVVPGGAADHGTQVRVDVRIGIGVGRGGSDGLGRNGGHGNLTLGSAACAAVCYRALRAVVGRRRGRR